MGSLIGCEHLRKPAFICFWCSLLSPAVPVVDRVSQVFGHFVTHEVSRTHTLRPRSVLAAVTVVEVHGGREALEARRRHLVIANYCSQARGFGFCDCKLRVTQLPEGEGLLRHPCSLLPHYHSGWRTIDFACHCAAVLSSRPSLGDETQDGTCRHMLIGCSPPACKHLLLCRDWSSHPLQ